MDEEVDPCDDFYKFACGSFIKNTVIPREKTSVSQFTVVSDALKIKMKKLVEAPVAKDEPESSKLIKNLFISCKEKGEGCDGGRREWVVFVAGGDAVARRKQVSSGEGV